jgi:hypothetical protein
LSKNTQIYAAISARDGAELGTFIFFKHKRIGGDESKRIDGCTVAAKQMAGFV